MSELALILIKEAKAARKKSLDLGNCGLTDIPKEVFQLTWLEELNLCNAYEKLDTNKTIESKNQGTPNRLNIEKLPDEFTQLCELRTLRINGNFKNFKFGGYVINRFRINNFDILKKLEKLTNIDLSFNKISDYSFLQNLSNLQSLDLRSNQISDISFLQNLSNLQSLDLRYNKISDIEQLLSLLKAGKSIGSGYGYDIIIENNPIEKPPSEIIKQGRKSVIEWFEANKKKLNEIKVSLLGDGKAGKTSLLKRLKYNEYSDNEEQTEGINIEQFEFGKLDTFNDQNNLQDITGYFWDFGGQEIMSSTHKFFMTRRTVYIIVCEARNDGQIDVNISDWVKRIRTYAGNSKIIVAINKIDKTPGYSINKHELIKEFPQIVDIVGISCKVDINIDKIKYLLEQTIPKAELFNTEIDERWISLKDILRERTSEIPYLSKKYVKDICENICDIKSEINLKGAIEFLNDLGIILHFEEIRLDDYFVFDPEWVTCGIYKIINSKMVSDNNGEIDINKDLDFIINKEKPEKKQFYISKDKEEIEYSSQEMLYLLEIMEQFELGYHFDNKKKFLIPDLLSNEIPIDNYNRISEDPNNLRLVYQYEYLPKSIIHRLIIHLRKDIQNRWKTGVILSRFEDNSATGIITSSKNELKIYVIGKNKAKREYLSVIRYFINQLSSQIKEPNILVPLPGHDKFVEYEILIEMENDGETFYKDYKLKEKFKISKLLEGIETNEQVIIRGRNIEEHYHYHTHYHEGDKNMKIGKIEAQNGSKQVFADNIENVNMENKELNANQIGKIVDAILELPEDDQEHVSADLTIINNDGIPDNVKKISESRIKSFLKGSVPVIQSFTSSMLVEIAKKWAGLN